MAVGKPNVFIGSSSKGKKIAYALQGELDQHDCEAEVWTQGTFGASKTNIESLEKALRRFHAAVLVLTPDDLVHSGGNTAGMPRDNVLFEGGFFMGGLGRDRTFIVRPSDADLKLPTDLDGIVLLKFQPHSSGKLGPALGPVAGKIKDAIDEAGPPRSNLSEKLEQVNRSVIAAGERGPDEQTYYDKLSQVMEAEELPGLALLYADIDKLRSITRSLFIKEKQTRADTSNRLKRRAEEQIRADFILALNIAMTDSIYELHPQGLKHDIFKLPDPDVVVVGRRLSHDRAVEVARHAQHTFGDESKLLLDGEFDATPSVTILVSGPARLDTDVRNGGVAAIHRCLRNKLAELKESSGRGKIYEL